MSGATTGARAQNFADRLNKLEENGDVDAFVSAVFAADVELHRPESGQQLAGPEGATTYWKQYLGYFATIRSEFSRVVESDQLGILEWTSTGRLQAGNDISYRGVSLLDFDADGKVTRFATYYDTTPFRVSAG